jgi:N-acetylmuramoyl-L-alanine amidase
LGFGTLMILFSTRSVSRRNAGSMLLALIAALVAPLSPAAAAAITGVAVSDGAITLSFDDMVADAHAFLLDAPYRIAVDLAGITGGHADATGGPVIRTRIGQPHDGATRVVFDLAGPTRLRAATLAPDHRSMTLALGAATDLPASARAGAAQDDDAQMALVSQSAAVSVPLAPVRPYRLSMPAVSGRADKPLVVIDAGHGGHDPGSLSLDGTKHEKDAALAIARTVRDALLASGRVRVALTRPDDTFVTLGERPEIARRLGADLFISIHADSAPGSTARGATIYTLSEVASDRVAARLAAKENRADVLNGVDLGAQTSDVSSILIDLTQRETMNASSRFADLMQRELTQEGVTFKTTYHRFAGLAVLKAPDVPAILLECGYMSDPQDLELLFSKSYQHEIADGVTRAVEAHFARRLGKTDVASRD